MFDYAVEKLQRIAQEQNDNDLKQVIEMCLSQPTLDQDNPATTVAMLLTVIEVTTMVRKRGGIRPDVQEQNPNF